MRPTRDDTANALAQICGLEQRERERRWLSVSHFVGTAVRASELSDGVSFEFSRTGETLRGIVDFLRVECGCCPTLAYTLRPGSADGTITLDIRTSGGDVVALKALYGQFLRA
jgi:hypothetical protein